MRNFLGQDGFIWWIGIVEDVDDPLKLGRCRVRIFGYHPRKKDETTDNGVKVKVVAKEDLPWATAIMPVNTHNLYSSMEVGEWVLGFFLDGVSAQEPAIIGYFPSIPTDMAAGQLDPEGKGWEKLYFGEEPKRVYNSQTGLYEHVRTFKEIAENDSIAIKNTTYWVTKGGHKIIIYETADNNSVGPLMRFETSGGQKIELSDATDSESITISHKSGTSIAIDANGNLSITATGNLTLSGKDVSISGNTLTLSDSTVTYTPSDIKDEQDAQDAEIDLIKEEQVAQDVQIEIAKTLPVVP